MWHLFAAISMWGFSNEWKRIHRDADTGRRGTLQVSAEIETLRHRLNQRSLELNRLHNAHLSGQAENASLRGKLQVQLTARLSGTVMKHTISSAVMKHYHKWYGNEAYHEWHLNKAYHEWHLNEAYHKWHGKDALAKSKGHLRGHRSIIRVGLRGTRAPPSPAQKSL